MKRSTRIMVSVLYDNGVKENILHDAGEQAPSDYIKEALEEIGKMFRSDVCSSATFGSTVINLRKVSKITFSPSY